MKALLSTYRMTLSDGSKVQVTSRSAAEAIEDARWKHRGRTVVECYSGLTEEDCVLVRQIDRDARPIAGRCIHDVPRHDAIPEGATPPSPRRKSDENIAAMFSTAEIAAK